jgi:hypothetical protein
MLQLLENLFGEALSPARRVVVFTTPSRQTRLFADYQQLAGYANKQSRSQNVYFGLGLVAGTPRGRGKQADIAAIGGLWADIDVSSQAHPKPNLPQSIDEAHDLLAHMPLAPSAVVYSGHGLHAYWFFHEPWLFADDADRQKAAALAKGWHALLCRKAAARGWALENLGDLTRVLRLPDTLNHNSQGPPVEVRLLQLDELRRYASDDFEPYLPAESEPQVVCGTLVLRPDAQPPAQKLLDLAGKSPLFWQTWNRQRTDLADPSASGYDLSLATIAALNEWTDQEIADLMIAFRRHHNDNPEKALRQDYLQRTIAKARQAKPNGEVVDISSLIGPSEPQPPAEPTPPDPGPMPDDLLDVPGFIRQVTDHTLAVSPYPQPALAFAAALVLQAFLAGRKVRDAADNRTNLYVLALANSGAGKNEPRKVNQRICVEVGLQDCLGDAFASGEGIEDRLFLTPSVLFQTDEIDGLMNAINQASDARHEGIMNVLLKMYTSSSSIYPMRVKAGGRSPGVIDQPSLCMLGTAVPKYYYEALSVRMLNNGFFARLIVLEAGKRGRGQTPVSRPIPEAILQTARWWADFRPGEGNLQNWHPIPVCVEATPEAEAALEEFHELADDRYAEAEDRDDPAGMAIWARAYEKARKLALIYAASENRLQMRIGEPAVRWAWRFVDYQTRRMLFMAGQHVAEGEFDARCKRMLEVLTLWRQRRGDAWMPHWELSRRLKWSDKDIEEVRHALRGQRRIEHDVGSTPVGGPVAVRYRLLAPSGGEQLPQLPHQNAATGDPQGIVAAVPSRLPPGPMRELGEA